MTKSTTILEKVTDKILLLTSQRNGPHFYQMWIDYINYPNNSSSFNKYSNV